MKKHKFKHVDLSKNPQAFIQKDAARKAEIALAKGWGQMGHVPYHPFLPVQSFNSCGFSSRIPCPKTGEIIHTHSIGELSWARILMWSNGHRRLFSQVALERTNTCEIAKRLGIRHPIYRYTTVPVVMTMDFVHQSMIGKRKTVHAYQIKSKSTPLSDRSKDLLRISEAYARDQGWSWHLLNKEEAPSALLNNIKWVEAFVRRKNLFRLVKEWRSYEAILYTQLLQYPNPHRHSLSRICSELDSSQKVKRGFCLTVVRYLIANRIWDIDWNKPIDPSMPLELTGRYLGASK